MIGLKKGKDGIVLPITVSTSKVCTPQELMFFFRHCFGPEERKFKMILLLQLGAECRVHEACAVNLRDFHKNTEFRELDVLIQKKKTNFIEHKVLPEAIAAHIRSWIYDNWNWICEHEGFIFPGNHIQKKGSYTRPLTVERWFCKKRRQLSDSCPGMGFDKVIGTAVYKDLSSQPTKRQAVESRHLWSSHMMKRFAGTYAYLMTKDPVFVQKLLCHDDARVTQKHYIDGATVLLDRERIKNKLFDYNFYDAVTKDKNNISAVWKEFKRKKLFADDKEV